MSDHAAAQEVGPKAIGAISPIWALIGIIMIVALYTTIHGLYSLTGSWIYAIPFGFVAQSILLIVALNLGRDLARRATGRAEELKITPTARTLRTLFLTIVYLLFFGICWFFAFSTYYNIFLARGDDVQTTASQAVQLGDVVLPTVRTRIDERVKATAQTLQNGDLVTGFDKRVKDLLEAAARPETSATIADAAFKAAQDAFNTRQNQRTQWRTEETTLTAKQTDLQRVIEKLEKELSDLKAEQGRLPDRTRDLSKAIQEEFPPSQPALAPQQVKVGQLKADGLASTLVSNPACHAARLTGKGDCLAALQTALQQGETRLAALPQEVTSKESQLESARAQANALPKRLAQIEELLRNNQPLPAPLPRDSTSAAKSGPDLGPLAKARQDFANAPTEATFGALSDACRPIEAALRGLKPIPPVLSGFECRPPPVLAAVEAQGRLVAAHSGFLDQCGQSVVSERAATIVSRMRDDFTRQQALRSDDAARRERLGQAIDEVRHDVVDPCLALASQFGVPVEDLNRQARAFEDRISPRQTDFSLAANAVVQVITLQATPPGYLGALFAAAQELAILLLSILRDINRGVRPSTQSQPMVSPSNLIVNWGPDPNDPPPIAAIKIILQSPGNQVDDSIYLPAAFGDDEKPELQANIQQILRELKREGLARPTFFRRATRLKPKGVEKLENRIKDYVAARDAHKANADPQAPVTDMPPAATAAVQQTTDDAPPSVGVAANTDDLRSASIKGLDIPGIGTGRRQIGTRS